MRSEELVASIAALTREDLEDWLREDLVRPRPAETGPVFAEAECARVRLLVTLRHDLEVDAETLPLVVSLLDQLYDSRRRLRALGAAVAAQGPEVRDAVVRALEAEDDAAGA